MLYIKDVTPKPNTATRVWITYWTEGGTDGPTECVLATIRDWPETAADRLSWKIKIDGRSALSIVRKIKLDGKPELILEL